MHLNDADLLAKPTAASSAFQPGRPSNIAGSGGGTVTTYPGGKCLSLYCKRDRHDMCRFEQCDCECHEKKKAQPTIAGFLRPAEVREAPKPQPTEGEKVWKSHACQNDMHVYCQHIDCECGCHHYDNDALYNPAFKHEMSR